MLCGRIFYLVCNRSILNTYLGRFVLNQYFKARNVRVTHDELLYLQENLTDLIQVDHHDYPAVMGIFHHLHCLNNLRKIVHWEYYGPLMEGEDDSLSKGHSGTYSNLEPVFGIQYELTLTWQTTASTLSDSR